MYIVGNGWQPYFDTIVVISYVTEQFRCLSIKLEMKKKKINKTYLTAQSRNTRFKKKISGR